MSGTQLRLIGAGSAIFPTAAGSGVLGSGKGGGAANPLSTLGNSAATLVTTGSTTASTLSTILSLSGQGVLQLLLLTNQSAASKTLRMKVTVDGAVVFDSTSSTNASNTTVFEVYGSFLPVFNGASMVSAGYVPESIGFRSSLLIEYAGSITEASGATIAYRYLTT